MNRLAITIAMSLSAGVTAAAEPVDFVAEVKPIFVQHCQKCHGPQKQEGGLRADTAGGLVRGGGTGPAVVAGKSSESLLMKALLGEGDTEQMPAEADPLSDAQIALIKRWIDEGAKAPPAELVDPSKKAAGPHWAFQPVVRPQTPQVRDARWSLGPIDPFVLARLEAKNIAPSPEADRLTLIRRLSLDLLGLLPSPDETAAFLADESPDAFERLVDRLLTSPHYAERSARHWLDQARYGDSNGFTIDGPRSIWKYRDWVIAALAADMPFDRFAIEQIAGDLLPNPSPEQLIATGFHRNTLLNQEGGTDPEQFRVEAVVDRVNTTGTVFLGLTVGCAQCHDHKYDPISHRDYYRLFAFFNGADEPNILAPSTHQAAQLETIQRELAAADAELRRYDEQAKNKTVERPADDAGTPVDAQAASLVSARNAAAWTILDPSEFRSANGANMIKLGDRSVLVTGDAPATDVYTVTLDVPPGPITAVRVDALRHDTLPKQGPGLSENGNFVLGTFKLAAAPLKVSGEPGKSKDWSIDAEKSFADVEAIDRALRLSLDDKPRSGWSVPVTAGMANSDHRATFVLGKKIAGKNGTRLVFVFSFQDEVVRNSFGRFQLSATGVSVEQLAEDQRVGRALATPAEKRTQLEKDVLTALVRSSDPARTALARRVEALRDSQRQLVGAIPTTMVMRERKAPRETTVMIRGDFLRKGDPVVPGVPEVLPPLPGKPEKPSRLDLANWLIARANPLTGRVTVNRWWQRFFGAPLVETENDFGAQGAPPTHPELLDLLADELFVRHQSAKAMHRLLLTSAVYRQASLPRPDLSTLDPNNKLFARQARVRLEAEAIRDVSLAASGMLCSKIGGPGVFPPQPAGIYRFTQQDKQWRESQGEDRFRRGMYTYFFRSSPYPLLTTFDAPAGTVSCTRRTTSNTPLQALTLANDRSLFEMAQALARRVLAEGPKDDAARIDYAFRLCLVRPPSDAEAKRLYEMLSAELQEFGAAADEAKLVAPANSPASATVAEGAAWTAVARVLLNVDEFITRE